MATTNAENVTGTQCDARRRILVGHTPENDTKSARKVKMESTRWRVSHCRVGGYLEAQSEMRSGSLGHIVSRGEQRSTSKSFYLPRYERPQASRQRGGTAVPLLRSKPYRGKRYNSEAKEDMPKAYSMHPFSIGSCSVLVHRHHT